MAVTIENIRVICTAPEGISLPAVRVDTNVPGLYGLGCGLFLSVSGGEAGGGRVSDTAFKGKECGKYRGTLAAMNFGVQEWSGIEPPNFVIQDLKGPKGALLEVFYRTSGI